MSSVKRAIGIDPYTTESGIVIRRSVAIDRGLQTFWKDGMPIGVGHFGQAYPEFAGKFDTIVLNDLEYEAVKKSEMERAAREHARSFMKGKKLGKLPYNLSH